VTVEAWIDRNENGRREPEEEPLEDVNFQAEWFTDFYGDNACCPESAYPVSDATGRAEFVAKGCGSDHVLVHAETPSGYRLVARDEFTFGFAPLAETMPAGRMYHSLAYVSTVDRFLLLGGVHYHSLKIPSPTPFWSEVWTYDLGENEWEMVGELEPGYFSSLAYDEESDRVIVLNTEGETWAYQVKANRWERMSPTVAPRGRCGHQMAYDSGSDRIVLFGGYGCEDGLDTLEERLLLNEIWSYDYNTDIWTQMQPQVSPPARINHSMVYHAEADRVIVWGGRPRAHVSDVRIWTYDYDADSWTPLEPEGGPARRLAYTAVVYHPPSGRILLFGGIGAEAVTSSQFKFAETWSYDLETNAWTLLEPSPYPSARCGHAMAYSSTANKIVLFGGVINAPFPDFTPHETWIFDPSTNEWANVTPGSTDP
jgi:N-acetylneuraminic acid mutarotase